ncbi:MobC family replication-relaxation protein [Citrobacter amalonaticus]|uniref:MobC family replication-relaxation protein n=1 Tax=Citrobacter amalonaticus TaxID=35703 RepID=UPI001A3335A1|nr:molybdopterin-guanine dinucleotide biosynthesis protein MobC [Citrobacter amalonaticus]HDQ2811405.1 molybdopterin-guanine dinucleotide biosynthesis protein MobC [Citrobacter amalonaticus]
MLIHNPSERKKIADARMLTLLNFLKDETWSDFSTLRRKLGFSDSAHSPLYKLLNKAIQDGLIIKHVIPETTRKTALWGITMQGLSRVVTQDDPVFPAYFEPGKLSYQTLHHHLFNQRIRLALEDKGGNNWCNGDRKAFAVRFPGVRHRPDGVITLSNGAIVAVEAERTLKTRARYINIISSHLSAIDAGYWHYAVYATPNETTRKSLKRLFDGIRTVERKNIPVPFSGRNRERFLLRTVDELERSTPENS